MINVFALHTLSLYVDHGGSIKWNNIKSNVEIDDVINVLLFLAYKWIFFSFLSFGL